MEITLKNIKHSGFASRETHCFQASIYVDGKRSGTVENSGYGGCNDEHWDDSSVMDAVYDWVKTLPPVEVEWGDGTMSQSFDTLIGELVNDWLTTKDIKREMRKGLVVFDSGCEKGSYRVFNHKMFKTNPQGMFDGLKRLKHVEADAVCLNVLPIEEAVRVWKGE
jgi:hypothetical protein